MCVAEKMKKGNSFVEWMNRKEIENLGSKNTSRKNDDGEQQQQQQALSPLPQAQTIHSMNGFGIIQLIRSLMQLPWGEPVEMR